jgi:hypothetical protein
VEATARSGALSALTKIVLCPNFFMIAGVLTLTEGRCGKSDRTYTVNGQSRRIEKARDQAMIRTT